MFKQVKALVRRRVPYPNSTPYSKRFSIKTLENVLLLLSVVAIGMIGVYSLLAGTASQDELGQGDAQLTSTSPADPMLPQNHGSELRSQLAQEQLNASQEQIAQLEAQ